MTASAIKFEKGARVLFPQEVKGKKEYIHATFEGSSAGEATLEISAEDADRFNGGFTEVFVDEAQVLPYISAESVAPSAKSAAPVRDSDDEVLDYLNILFETGDNIFTTSEIGFKDDARISIDKSYIQKLRQNNLTGNVYVAMNPLAPGQSRRQKHNFEVPRNVFMECDSDGEAVLAKVREAAAAGTIPNPTTILRSSPGKYQFAWRVNSADFTKKKVEAINSALVKKFGGDPACVDCLRLFRLPTFVNRKYTDGPVCELVETRAIDQRYNFSDFKLSPAEAAVITPAKIDADKKELIAIRDHFETNATAAHLQYSPLQLWGESGWLWEIECPWRSEHTTNPDGGTIVILHKSGALDFSCLHGHCRERTWTKDFRPKLAEMAGVPWQSFGDPVENVNLNTKPAEVSATQAAPADQAWEDPQPVASSLLPVLPFKLSFLPSSMKNWAKDVSERMSVPLDFVGISVLCALAGCINRRAFVYPKQNDPTWREAISVSGAVIAMSGKKKTPTWKTMTGPMYEIEAKWQTEYNDRLGVYEAEMARYKDAEKLRIKATKKDESDAGELFNSTKPSKGEAEPTKPTPRRRLIVNDATPESMHAIMSDNPEGLFVYRDEMSGWIAELDQKGRESERSMFLAAMNGNDPHTLDRIGRGSITSTMSASLFGGFQPDPLIKFLCDTRNTTDGLVARFGLLVWPDGEVSPRIDRAPDEMARAGFRHALQVLSSLRESSICLKFSLEAQTRFDDWCDALNSRVVREENSGKCSHISKYDGLLVRLAGLLQLADIVAVVASVEGGTYVIDEDHLGRAIDLLAYLESHACRIYACVKGPEQIARETLAQRVQAHALRDGFTVRDIERSCWKGLAKQYAGGAVDDLEDLGWIRRLPTSGNGKGGRPSLRFEINPKLKVEIKGRAA